MTGSELPVWRVRRPQTLNTKHRTPRSGELRVERERAAGLERAYKAEVDKERALGAERLRAMGAEIEVLREQHRAAMRNAAAGRQSVALPFESHAGVMEDDDGPESLGGGGGASLTVVDGGASTAGLASKRLLADLVKMSELLVGGGVDGDDDDEEEGEKPSPRSEGAQEYVRRLEREKAQLQQQVMRHEEERMVQQEQHHNLRMYAEESLKVRRITCLVNHGPQ